MVLMLAPELYAPLRSLGTLFHASADGLAVADRILDVLEPDGPAADGAASGARLPDWAHVCLAGIGVRQPGRDATVPRDLDLDLRRGEVVALVGPSGAGKSTVAAVLLGLRRPDDGRVTVDGRDLDTLDLAWWHIPTWTSQRSRMTTAVVASGRCSGAPGPGGMRSGSCNVTGRS